MIEEKYVLNQSYGINEIDCIRLKKIFKVFKFPKNIQIEISKSRISLDVVLIYDNMEIYYTLYYFVEELSNPEFQTLAFKLTKLYLNKNENIKVGDNLKKVLTKIKKYLKKNRKSTEFEYEEDFDKVRYLFDNGKIDLFFDKYGEEKILEAIFVSLPYEDILEKSDSLNEIEKIIEIRNKIINVFYDSY